MERVQLKTMSILSTELMFVLFCLQVCFKFQLSRLVFRKLDFIFSYINHIYFDRLSIEM